MSIISLVHPVVLGSFTVEPLSFTTRNRWDVLTWAPFGTFGQSYKMVLTMKTCNCCISDSKVLEAMRISAFKADCMVVRTFACAAHDGSKTLQTCESLLYPEAMVSNLHCQ